MSQSLPRLTADECARRGREIYEREIAGRLEESNYGQVVAIDVETGGFEVAPDTLTAAELLRRRSPDAEIWLARVGQGSLHRIGAGRRIV